MACTCGHDEAEHGNDLKYPNATDCNEDGCDCIAFEDDGSAAQETTDER